MNEQGHMSGGRGREGECVLVLVVVGRDWITADTTLGQPFLLPESRTASLDHSSMISWASFFPFTGKVPQCLFFETDEVKEIVCVGRALEMIRF